jgi:hypothetical protein
VATEPHSEPHWWSLRARGVGTETAVFAGRSVLRVGRPLAFEPAAAPQPPTALEAFVGALAGDLLQGFRAAAGRRRLPLDDLEMSLRWALENPLTHFGVRGEAGTPRVRQIRGTLFVSGVFDGSQRSAVAECWEETLERSPLFQTLRLAAALDLGCRIV